MAINKQQIFKVADELDATGYNPTLAAVRKLLGGGSFTTISEAMNEWRAAKMAKSTTAREPAPAIVLSKLNELGTEIWAQAITLAEGRLQHEKEELGLLRAQINADRQETAELADGLYAELEILQQRLQETENILKQEIEATLTIRDQLQKTNERAIAAEARAGEIEKRADNLNAELERVNIRNGDLIRLMTDKLSEMADKKLE